MALQVNLTLNKTYFVPGELVQVCVQIFNAREGIVHNPDRSPPAQQTLHIKELSFQANGSERTDSSFVHRLHHPEVLPEVADARKRIRNIFSTESAVLISDQALDPYAARSFQLRFRLPSLLPPSFRGSAVRFFYMIHVKAVYEVQTGEVETVVYETTASTTLTIWPSHTVAGLQMSSSTLADRRGPALDTGQRRGSELPGGGSYSGDLGELTGLMRISGTAGSGGSSGGGYGGSGTAPCPSPHAGGTVHGGGGGEDGDVAMCDYVLGKNCRIRWLEVQGGGPLDSVSSSSLALQDRESASPASFAAADDAVVAAGAVAVTAQPSQPLHPIPGKGASGGGGTAHHHHPRGVIPFGINRPFPPPFPLHLVSGPGDTDSDTEGPVQNGSSSFAAGASTDGEVVAHAGINGVAAANQALPPSHVQRQVSAGTTGLQPYTRQPSRRSSLFGKVYSLNVGDQPLMRVVLQAPLEVPLQPGTTFGGVLDFRHPLALAALAAAGQRSPPVTCYGVAVLLETEEVLSPECRQQLVKRAGDGASGGAPYIIRRLYGEHHELPSDSALTSFTFSLPATAAPSFRTPLVALRWVMRFELTVGPHMSFATVDRHVRSLRSPLEQLVWSLPLHLRSPIAIVR